MAVGGDGFSRASLGFAVAILLGGVDEVEAPIEEFSDETEDALFAGIGMSVGLAIKGHGSGELPGADTKWGNLEAGLS
jgi:hypothetical protein